MRCSFARPTSRPTMLHYQDLVSLFDTFGSAVHSLVSKPQYSRFHSSNLPLDFAVLPGELMQNWCWDPSILKKIGKHYSYISPMHLEVWKRRSKGLTRPDERLSDDAVAWIHQRSYSSDVMHQLLVLHWSLFDITVHSPKDHEQIQKIKPAEIWNRSFREIMQMDDFEACGYDSEWGHGYANFEPYSTHFAASYYSYLL
jgi:metallopeptidase MepB